MTARLKKIQRQVTTPAAAEWKYWNNMIESGHFYVFESDINDVRKRFLEQGISPKVLLKDELHPRTLIHSIGNQEPCVVHALPDTSGAMEQWLKRLDIGLEYRGEGLPALSLKVLQTLVKRSRERVWLTGEEKAAVLEEYGFSSTILLASASPTTSSGFSRCACSATGRRLPMSLECTTTTSWRRTLNERFGSST